MCILRILQKRLCYHSPYKQKGTKRRPRDTAAAEPQGEEKQKKTKQKSALSEISWVLVIQKGPGSILFNLAEEMLSEVEGRAQKELPERWTPVTTTTAQMEGL